MTTKQRLLIGKNQIDAGHPFKFVLASGNNPSVIVDKNNRVVATIDPLFEEAMEQFVGVVNLVANGV